MFTCGIGSKNLPHFDLREYWILRKATAGLNNSITVTFRNEKRDVCYCAYAIVGFVFMDEWRWLLLLCRLDGTCRQSAVFCWTWGWICKDGSRSWQIPSHSSEFSRRKNDREIIFLNSNPIRNRYVSFQFFVKRLMIVNRHSLDILTRLLPRLKFLQFRRN